MKHKKPSLAKKLKPHYTCDVTEDNTKVEIWAKKNPLGQIVAWVREVTNPFGEKMPKETVNVDPCSVESMAPDFGHYQSIN